MNGSKVGQVVQDVTIPSAPATLTFYLRIQPGTSAPIDSFKVYLDNNVELRSISANTAGFNSFALVTVDVSAHTGHTR